MTFKELNLSAPLLRAVQEAGYETPSPIQAAAIPPVLAGRDLMGCAQTGTGKTAAFALPMLDRLSAAGPRPQGGGRGRVRAPPRGGASGGRSTTVYPPMTPSCSRRWMRLDTAGLVRLTRWAMSLTGIRAFSASSCRILWSKSSMD